MGTILNYDNITPTLAGTTLTVSSANGFSGNGGRFDGRATHKIARIPSISFVPSTIPVKLVGLVKPTSLSPCLSGISFTTGSGLNGYQALLDNRNGAGASTFGIQLRMDVSSSPLSATTPTQTVTAETWYRVELTVRSDVNPARISASFYNHNTNALLGTLTSEVTNYNAATLYPAFYGYNNPTTDNLRMFRGKTAYIFNGTTWIEASMNKL